jgi:hypothetical protein
MVRSAAVLLATVFGTVSLAMAALRPGAASTDAVTEVQALTARDSIIRRRDELTRQFIFFPDSVGDGGYYQHQRFFPPNRLGHAFLDAMLDHRGGIHLQAHRYHRPPIRLERLSAHVGSQEFTPEVPQGESVLRVPLLGGPTESLFFDRYSDRGLLVAIAAASDKSVQVRFIGADGEEVVMLSGADKTALAQSWEFAWTLRQVGRLSGIGADTMRFLADVRSGRYHAVSCIRAPAIPIPHRREYVGERAARAAGYSRSRSSGC